METVGGRYALDGRLGEGGMGCVYRARHIQLGKAFALKLISPAFALDAVARQRFNDEAKLASEITHPNIVSVVDFGEDPQFGAYMVMELIEGEPLVAPSAGPQSIRRTCESLAQVADALEHIHRCGIVHGDVKAENIMLTEETSGPRRRMLARLLDFGLARRHNLGGDGREEMVSGSPHYLAPERAAGGAPSVVADVYALGVLGYLIIAGALPFDGENVVEVLTQHIQAEPKPLAERRGEEVDAALDALIMRAMAKSPAQRHASAAAFRYELNAVMDMLSLTQRKRSSITMRALPEATRDVGIVAAFERSRLPQAFVTAKGAIVTANKAFAKLVGKPGEGLSIGDTSLAENVPGLLKALVRAHETGKSQECRAFVSRGESKAPLELSVWFSPLPIEGQEVHVIVRVIEAVTV